LVTFTQYNRNTLQKHLESLVKNNQIQRNGVGKGTWYNLI
jgi:predicted HTH transcriptional regulator